MKYRANIGGGIVEAQKIKDYRFDAKAQQQYLILGDDTRRPQPVLHGMKPMIGDWYVETSTGTTRLRDGSQYEERSAAAIIKAVDFAMVYTPVPESGEEEPTFKKDVNEVTQDGQIEWTNFGKVTTSEEPYEVVVMPDQVGPMQEIINADDTGIHPVFDDGDNLNLMGQYTDPAEVEEMLKQSLPKIAKDVAILGDDFETELTPEEVENLEVVRADVAAQEVSDNDIREADEIENKIEDGDIQRRIPVWKSIETEPEGQTYSEQDASDLDTAADAQKANDIAEMVDNQTADGE